MNDKLKNRWQQLAGLKEAASDVEEKEQLNESFMNLGMANVGVVGGNPFGNRKPEPEYNFEGILEEMAPELDPDKVDVKDDHEGEMAHRQLEKIQKYADELIEKLPRDAELEAWVQSKLTLASEMMDVVAHYLQDEAGDDQQHDAHVEAHEEEEKEDGVDEDMDVDLELVDDNDADDEDDD